jgi:hypothetical protein
MLIASIFREAGLFQIDDEVTHRKKVCELSMTEEIWPITAN